MTNRNVTSDDDSRQREVDFDSTKNGETTPSPAPGNTGEQNSHSEAESRETKRERLAAAFRDQPETGGIDTLEVSLCVHFPEDVWQGLEREWDEAKQRAADLVEAGADEKQSRWGWASPEGDVLGVGSKGIKGGFRAKWVLHWAGMTFLVSGRRSFKEGKPNLRVIIPSTPLMQRGSRRAWDDAHGVLKGMGGEVIDSVVSRVDVCVDLVGVGVGKFFAHFKRRAFISDAKRWELYGEGRNFAKPESIYVGKQTRCRIYDKEKETRRDLGKREIMAQRRWGRMLDEGEDATRVEFQIRREQLQEKHGIRTVEQLYEKLPTLCEWCTGKFLRLCADGVTNNNHQRAQTAALWQRVADAFEAWAGTPLESWVQPVKRFRAQGAHLVAMIRGVVSTHMARFGTEADQAMGYSWGILREIVDEIQEAADAKRERYRFEAIGPPIDEGEIPF